MSFSVMTPLGEHLSFGDEASFELSEQGILVIREPDVNEQLTLSPSGWSGITEELPPSETGPSDPPIPAT